MTLTSVRIYVFIIYIIIYKFIIYIIVAYQEIENLNLSHWAENIKIWYFWIRVW